jgi:hypothetical protein
MFSWPITRRPASWTTRPATATGLPRRGNQEVRQRTATTPECLAPGRHRRGAAEAATSKGRRPRTRDRHCGSGGHRGATHADRDRRQQKLRPLRRLQQGPGLIIRLAVSRTPHRRSCSQTERRRSGGPRARRGARGRRGGGGEGAGWCLAALRVVKLSLSV